MSLLTRASALRMFSKISEKLILNIKAPYNHKLKLKLKSF